MNHFITGYNGFIAQYLRQHLKDQTINGYTTNVQDFVDIPKDTDIVWHLGAKTRPQESMEHRHRYIVSNALGTVKVLKSVQRNCPKAKVVYFGSATQDYLDSWYGYTKHMGALACDAYEQFDKLKIYKLKLFGVTGIGHRNDVINDFAEQAAKFKHIKHGELDYMRDISDVRDVVPYIYNIITTKSSDTYYVGRGEATSIRAIANWFKVPLELEDSRVRHETKVHVSSVKNVGFRPIEETLEWIYESWKTK